MYNSNLVKELTEAGIAIQAAGGILSVALEGKSLDGKEGAKYRQRIYPAITAWMRKGYIAVENGELTSDQLKTIQSVVKEDAIARINRARGVKPVVVVDEVAELKAELESVKADRKAVVQELETIKQDNRDLTQKLSAYQTLVERLKSRTVVIGNVITKVFVDSKVENKSNFR